MRTFIFLFALLLRFISLYLIFITKDYILAILGWVIALDLDNIRKEGL